jgi:hypothetical protein
MTDRASIARPGFHKALFGHDPSQVDAVIQELQVRVETAERDARVAHARIRELEEAQSQRAAPTFDDLGARLVAILSLAEEEAAERRGAAEIEAREHREEALAAAKTIRADAERYAEGVRKAADTEAAEVLEEARSRANDMREDAEREASARRAEAEALFEAHRANAAAAAADLERSLAARREEAASEIAKKLAVHEDSLQAAEERAVQLTEQSEAAYEEARAIANAHIAQAEEQAALILQRARAQADRITRNSEREVTAASARRDSINVQLDNLRQMLATLGGPAVAEQLLAEESAAPLLVRSPSVDGSDDSDTDHSGEGQDGGPETDQPRPAQEPAAWYETLETLDSSAMPADSGAPEATDGEAAGAGSRAARRSNSDSFPNARKTPPAPGRRNRPA